MVLSYLRDFARKHPDLSLPNALWLDAMAQDDDDALREDADLSVQQAVQRSTRNEHDVRGACKTGEISGAYQDKGGGRWRIPTAGLRAWMELKRQQGSVVDVRAARPGRYGPRKNRRIA